MQCLRNENGVALVTALLLTLIALAITMTLLYFVTMGAKMSGAHKQYKSSLDAGYGAATEVVPKDVLNQLVINFSNYSSAATATGNVTPLFASIGLQFPVTSDILKQKIMLPRADWTMSDSNKSADPKVRPDVTFKLTGFSAQPGFNIYAKIIDTIPGNSDTSGVELDAGLAVTGVGAGVAMQHLPSMYTIEVQAERETNPREKAQLSVRYAY
ncbi:MAG: hypothetical protein FD174_2396 [Geobacteraceae bacterium]|nr:MAG: hypothetical protein FD174_2396 [Geobacteraceae bacterium]